MPAGYSGTPLAKKLGIKEGHRVLLLDAPDDFPSELAPIPDDVAIKTRLSGGKGAKPSCDVILFFTTTAAALKKRFAALVAALDPAGGLWIAWPKKSSGVDTDLTFDVVQKTGLATGLVDNKICAVTEVWSGLRFVVRKENRPDAKKAQAPAPKKPARPAKTRRR